MDVQKVNLVLDKLGIFILSILMGAGFLSLAGCAPTNPAVTDTAVPNVSNPVQTSIVDEPDNTDISPDDEPVDNTDRVMVYESDRLRLYAENISRDCGKPIVSVSNYNNNGYIMLYVEPLTSLAESSDEMVTLNLTELKINDNVVNISSSSPVPESGGNAQFYWFVDQQSTKETKLNSMVMSFVVDFPDRTNESITEIEIPLTDIPIIQNEVDHTEEETDKNQAKEEADTNQADEADKGAEPSDNLKSVDTDTN